MDMRVPSDIAALVPEIERIVEGEAAYVRERRAAREYVYELDRKLAAIDLFAYPLPREHGGRGHGPVAMYVICEALARSGYPGMYHVTVFNTLNLLHHGTDEQRRRYVPAIVRGEMSVSIALSEPNAGSDLGALRTRGEVRGDTVVLNGQKVFQTGAARERNVMLMAIRTRPDSTGTSGISMALVPSDLPGLEFRRMSTLGRETDPLYEVFLTDVPLPLQNVVGPLHDGWRVVLHGLNVERVAACGRYVGTAERIARALAAFLGVHPEEGAAGDLGRLGAEIEAARWLSMYAAWLAERGERAAREISEAKLYAAELDRRAADVAMAWAGVGGVGDDLPFESFVRDTRADTVAGGTSQILRNTIARALGFTPG